MMSPVEVPVASESQIVTLLGVLCLDRPTGQFSNLWTSLPESIQAVTLILFPDSVRSVPVDQLLRILIGCWMVSFISLRNQSALSSHGQITMNLLSPRH